MINTILAAFDSAISSKCYISRYGRLAVTVRQPIPNGTTKRYPVSCALVDDCEDLPENHADLLPDDSKSGVAFWKQVQPITPKDLPVSGNRRLQAAETVLDLVVWVNLKKVTGESLPTDWCTLPDSLILDMFKTLDCKRKIATPGMTHINNLEMEVIKIGNIVTWKQAMAEYTIDSDNLVIWPFTGFTITVRLSFHINSACIPDFTCYNCDEITVEITPSSDTICVGGSIDIDAVVTGSTEVAYQWQMLNDATWEDIPGAVDITHTPEAMGPEGEYQYRVIATTCEGCTVTSEPITITVQDQPTVTVTADSEAITVLETTVLHNEVLGGIGGNNYQWQHFGVAWVNISGATGADMLVDGAEYGAGDHQFRLVVTQDLNCGVTSDPITIVIT